MKTPPRDPQNGTPGQRSKGAPESRPSRETFPRRTDTPGEVGLGNESRPGLGTRGDEPFPGEPGDSRLPESTEVPDDVARRQHSSVEPNDQPLPRDPQEQRADTWAQEAERDTRVSGELGNG